MNLALWSRVDAAKPPITADSEAGRGTESIIGLSGTMGVAQPP